MRRREFIAVVSGAAAAWPLFARGQQDERVRRVGFLTGRAESDLEAQSLMRGLVQRLQELGWTNGGNVQFDFRFGDADATRTSMLATELIELRATFARDPNGALVVLPGPVVIRHREAIIVAAARYRLPAIYPYSFFTTDGGLMSYGSDIADLYAASFFARSVAWPCMTLSARFG
jgi:hypothetical protein